MAGKTGKPLEILVRLAEGLDDKVLKGLFPDRDPAEIRKQLRKLAGIDAGESCQMKLPVAKVSGSGKFTLHTDGASRGNPGEAGAGACIFDSAGEEVFADCRYLGQCTNNVAEYEALLLGLQAAGCLKIDDLDVRLDSELIVRQLEGRYQVKDEKLKPLYREVKELLAGFANCRVSHVPRKENARADELANQAIDLKG